MAELLDQNRFYDKAFDWEPKHANRFILEIADIPAYIIKAAARPSLSNGEIVLDHINIDRKVKGKTRWNDISITLYDPIVPSGAQAVIEWIRLGHESVTGRNGYSDQYKKRLTFHSLGPVGDKVEEWTLVGAFINNADWGNMDWANDAAVEISLTLSYDYAILEY